MTLNCNGIGDLGGLPDRGPIVAERLTAINMNNTPSAMRETLGSTPRRPPMLGQVQLNALNVIRDLTMRLSDAGLRQRQTKPLYPNHRPPPWLTEDAPRDRSNRLLDDGSTALRTKASALRTKESATFAAQRTIVIETVVPQRVGVAFFGTRQFEVLRQHRKTPLALQCLIE
jgi:hypothetical protein